MTIRVLVADDHPMVRDGLTAMLDAQPDLAVVAQTGTGKGAEAAAGQHQPDVAVLDLRMPDGDGISATVAIRRASPATRILVLSTFDGQDEVAGALFAGASGYLVKTAAPEEIAQAVRTLAAGSSVLSDDVLDGLVQGSSTQRHRLFPELTAREAAVLDELTRGLTVDAAAVSLGLTAKTVRNHLASITAKLGVRDRTAAVLVARDRLLLASETQPSDGSARADLGSNDPGIRGARE